MPKRATGKRVVAADGTTTVRGKNANGAGSIYLDASSGTYRATYVDPVTGKRRTVSARTKGEAEARRAAKLAQLDAPVVVGTLGPDPTIRALAEWWLTTVAPETARPSTLHTYRNDVARITRRLGDLPVAQLGIEHVRTWLADLARLDGLGPDTRRNARTRLHQIAQHAVDMGHLAWNPVSRVPVPKAGADDRRNRRVLTPDEVRRILVGLDGSRPLDAAVALLLTAGLRVSSVLGLAWPDIDLDAATATVRRGSTYTGGGVGARLDDPKTRRTAGVHHLSPTAVALLRQRRTQQQLDRDAAGDRWVTTRWEGEPIDLVFTGRTGRMAVRQGVTVALAAACERAGVDPARVATHTGRRSVITALWADGVPLEDIARHVGHSLTETTAGYVVDLGRRPQAVAERAALLLDPEA